MDQARLVKVSKYLSKHLRHNPERLGLELHPGGWVFIDDLLLACGRQGFPLTREELAEVVARNDKSRYSLDESGTMIRANQGHSVAVDLQLAPVEPPAVLYHGTAAATVSAIRREGLRRMARQHVHLSGDPGTATAVGRRHGRPVVLLVDAAAMFRDGHIFYRSDNGVWLVEHIPAAYLRRYAGQ